MSLIFASLESHVGLAVALHAGWPLRASIPSWGLGLTHLGGEQLARLWVADGESNIGGRSLLVLPAR